ncbi:helix-turn-helix transcriptional regulator [Mucilaginibacter sp. ZT4R22]|uniref:Helix-turn-helix transcriptional regulator n=1 Tax=Mucilaginibacter pankratovii TaxID=2772110 RepID=A0ABR7WTZ1_9SPHI|nr:AraC family transcriptional regulator [Mucilaginibacter pankratovii]MBD1365773.1 helix-turn-helix transcriptional regulator [Mucilaginibacter pankratovii]
MYFNNFPDHAVAGFDEQSHFSRFKKHNIIFNAQSSHSVCDLHVGCLSFKTVISGEEWYGIGHRQIAVRPAKFLIMNNNQAYSSRIDSGEPVRSLSVFFKEEFASAVFRDLLYQEESQLDDPFMISRINPEFFQTLNDIDNELQLKLNDLISSLNSYGYNNSMVDEHLVFILNHLIRTQVSGINHANNINAVKQHTRLEIYKRLCVAKDVIESYYMEQPGLDAISSMCCLSIPQLIRQFKSVFNTTPHQYMIQVRLKRAVELLNNTNKPIHEITWRCGFENVSAFCRAFKLQYGIQPARYRSAGL